MIDLRSDTFTQPTEAMRAAMASAEVGDDVFKEDPTVNRLESLAAKMTGKEAALFVASGTMGNLVCVLSHCGRGDEIILGDRSHIFLNEVGGISALGGIHPRTVANEKDGTLRIENMEKAIRHQDVHYPPTRLICLENTHNYCQGYPLTPAYMKEVGDLAAKHAIKVHLDGARIFNAAVALEVDVGSLVHHADSVMLCLSKGLSAPIGSLICGTREYIAKARQIRKMVGGGMRQVGHLAAAGIISLETLTLRLQEDHHNAKALASGLASIPAIRLDLKDIHTNILFFQVDYLKISPDDFLTQVESNGVRILMIEPGVFRAVLHRGVSSRQVTDAVEIIRGILDFH